MYAKNKGGTSVSSDAQAREKLALYVYEYLLHVGAQKSAQTFLSEIRWEKNISLGEPPGFLHSWWCVFWDLYCAAPERRETNEHSSEAKAFHDYGFVNGTGYGPNSSTPGAAGPPGIAPPMQSMGPPTEGGPAQGAGAGAGPGPAGFYANNATSMRPTQQTSQPPMPQTGQGGPHQQQMMQSQYMGPRYPMGPRGPPGPPRMPMVNEYGGHPGHPGHPPANMMSNGTSDIQGRHMGQMNHRMNAPRGQEMGGMGPMGPMGQTAGIRGPNTGLQGGPPGPGVSFIGMVPPGGARPQWQQNTSSPMNNNGYPSASPGNYAGAPTSSTGHSGPGTPTMPSPQESGPEGNIYGMVKSGTVRGNSAPGEYGMAGGRSATSNDGNSQIRGMGQNSSMGSVLNNDSLANSPASGPATPRDVGNGAIADFGLPGFGNQGENGQMESAAILKIKESMQEEAKRFEKDSDQSDFFMR
ncbi:single-stranded DNA-binding protein 3-like [Athalia rosae]|uniref:single-stranded DNA-binding protein 3-like n=1 Tax=Athalia rosae TaxID=37344 RepID=UPI00203474D7|nr:single-stranded DNA-binding protein 3-like [Athalia rosae]